MRFTEHELTAALTGAAKAVLARRKEVRKGRKDVDSVWEELTRFQQFQMLDRLGDQILPVLVALPDVEVQPGTRPTYTDKQVREAVDALAGDEHGKLRRAVIVRARTALVQVALAALPPRRSA